jgi:general secretion pathway protein I
MRRKRCIFIRCAALLRASMVKAGGAVFRSRPLAGPAAGSATRGFTLIEVLVALAIVAVALAASVRAVGMLSFNDSLLRDKSLAALSAGNRLAELRLEKRFPDLGSLRVPCPQGRLQLECEQRVSGTPNPSFRQVSVRVSPVGRPTDLLVEVDGLMSALP